MTLPPFPTHPSYIADEAVWTLLIDPPEWVICEPVRDETGDTVEVRGWRADGKFYSWSIYSLFIGSPAKQWGRAVKSGREHGYYPGPMMPRHPSTWLGQPTILPDAGERMRTPLMKALQRAPA